MDLKMKIFRTLLTTHLCLFVLLTCMVGSLYAQGSFLRGVFGLDNPDDLNLNNDEMQLIYGTYANYLFGVVNDEPSVMIFCRDTTNGNIKMNIERDPTGHTYPSDDGNTSQFWKYISRNDYSNIDKDEIDTFVENVDNEWGSDVSGLASLLISHQGHTQDSDWWPYIQYTCHKIYTTFGGDVKSMVIDNITRPTKAFFPAVDSLDIFCHEQYPINTTTQGDNVDYTGSEIQTCFTNLVQNYDSCLVATKNVDTEWHAIIQVCEQEYYNSSTDEYKYWRRPTKSELWCQAFLAMSRGAKGIHYYLYLSTVDSTNIPSSGTPPNGYGMLGLVTDSREKFETYYSQVAQLDTQLTTIGPLILPLSVDTAFNCDNIPANNYIQDVQGDTSEAGTPTIEIGEFTDSTNPNWDYILLVNRRCSRDNNGTPAFPQNITLVTDKTSAYQLKDMVTEEIFVSSNGSFNNIVIDAGRGRLFELRPMFNQDENWSNSVYVCSDLTVPQNRTLTISSSTNVKFSSGTELKINGTLNAQGTSANPITFTSANASPAAGDWDWIKFDAGSGTMEYCNIEYARFGLWFYGASSDPTVENCTVENCSYYGAYFLNNSATTFQYNTLTDNSLHGLLLINSSPTLLNVYSSDNNHNGLFLHNSSPKIGSIDTMFNNQSQFSNNSDDGIFCSGSSGSHPWIYRNSVSNPDGGYVRIIGNKRGVAVQDSSQPILGSGSEGFNSIYNNTDYQIRNNNSSYSLPARYNWWGNEDGPPYGAFYGTVLAVPFLEYQPGGGVASGSSSEPAITLRKTNVTSDSLLERAQQLMTLGKYGQAVQLFVSIIQDDPHSTMAQIALTDMVLCYREMGTENDALSLLDQYAEDYNRQQIGYWAMNLSLPILELKGDYEIFIERCALLRAEFAGKDDLADRLAFDLGMVYKYGLHDLSSAKAYFEEFIKRKPDDPLADIAYAEMTNYGSPQRFFKENPNREPDQQDVLPTELTLFQNYPNPFNPDTEIRYQLPEAAHVKLEIYNLLGQKIRTLIDDPKPAGSHTLRWDGRDDFGAAVSSGVYLYRLTAGRFCGARKMVVMR
ncbi:MAG: right-handed parallel beta-helix repeat-containing protein [bacterium]|nr:right-handed parallel beta-helix repeat-containing protein [bacterium]